MDHIISDFKRTLSSLVNSVSFPNSGGTVGGMRKKLQSLQMGITKYQNAAIKAENDILKDVPENIDSKELSEKLTGCITEYHGKLMEKYNRG